MERAMGAFFYHDKFSDTMGIVFTRHIDSERLKVEALSFLSVPFSFLDFPDHSGVHIFFSFQDIDIFCNKKARKDSVPSFLWCGQCVKHSHKIITFQEVYSKASAESIEK